MSPLKDIFFLLIAPVMLMLPLAIGFYLLISPSDRIYEQWVRFRQAHSRLSLKDEHFRYFPRALAVARVCSVCAIVVCALTLYYLLVVFES